ncbi:hypothetical protein [Sulfuriroseicoccus oceanibius]|uniref:Uncharacterized protein n=1 Tax=Sulfuriroseicoccus oceanibius TaxID=2707525 RepID=A0A6B3L9D4_9BACT|nr:hypothetical protein [Sulfuriroseicoccus oceanibius]QQL43834.1 hypothetical protein G3M56_007975 [Sulfuriroseicoccus oceanibius]
MTVRTPSLQLSRQLNGGSTSPSTSSTERSDHLPSTRPATPLNDGEDTVAPTMPPTQWRLDVPVDFFHGA